MCHNKQGKHGFHYKKKEKNGVTKNIDINIVSYLISMARSRVPTIVEIETEIDIPLTSVRNDVKLWESDKEIEVRKDYKIMHGLEESDNKIEANRVRGNGEIDRFIFSDHPPLRVQPPHPLSLTNTNIIN